MEWISVKDKLPENSVDCLVVRKDDYGAVWIEIAFSQRVVGKFPHRFMINGESVMYAAKDVTHWMPMPELPSE